MNINDGILNSIVKLSEEINAIRSLIVNSSGVAINPATSENQSAILNQLITEVVTIDYAHEKIHAGKSYTTCKTLDITNGQNLDILFITPNDGMSRHCTYEYEAESENQFNIYEDATVSANGTGLNIWNRKRNSANVSLATAFFTPTVTGLGTEIRCWHSGGGKTAGGGDRATHEFLVKPNTKYLFRINNQTTSNNYMAIKLDWYEL